MRLPLLLSAGLAIAAQQAAADEMQRRDCTFARAGRPDIRSRCAVRSSELNGITDVIIRLDDSKALHLEGPLGGDRTRFRLQGGTAVLQAEDGVGRSCYVRDDGGMTLCLGRLVDENALR